MSIQIDGKTFRNLEEQVQYLTDLHEAGKALASWGIKVVGQVETADELPQNYTGDYGDAYAVGTEPPYDFYIWTRASIEYGEAYWFNFGQISIVGPQGPQGPQGEKGDNGVSSTWYTGAQNPQVSIVYKLGDMYLNTSNGQTYRYNGINWVLAANIMGPQGIQGIRGQTGPQGEQGPQGPKGDTGDVGGFINIAGILESADQLPTPESLGNLTIAYLVEHTGGTDQANDHYDLYIQVGSTSAEATWNNVGPFNAATLVTVNGVGQNVWNADTKIDDVRIKNVSQVTNGVANIPVATKDNLGVAKFGSGLFIDANGSVTPTATSNQAMLNKTDNFTKISPKNLEYAVKAGLVTTDVLTTNDGWNEDEKAAARETLGISGGGANLYKHKVRFNYLDNSGDGTIYYFEELSFVSPSSTRIAEIGQTITPVMTYLFDTGLIGMTTECGYFYYSEPDTYRPTTAYFNFRTSYDDETGEILIYASCQSGNTFIASANFYQQIGRNDPIYEYTITPL